MNVQLDHVVIAVHDLDRVARRLNEWFNLRFSPYGRPFPGAVNRLAYTVFGFLELITVEDFLLITKTNLGRTLADFLREREGVFSTALETLDIWKVAETCRREGAPVSTPKRKKIGNGLSFWMSALSIKEPWLIHYDWTKITFGKPRIHTVRSKYPILHHVGLASENGVQLAEKYSKYFGLKSTSVETIPELNTFCIRLPMAQGEILIMSPESEGPILEFIRQKGEGFVSWGLVVDNVEETIAEIRNSGVKPIPLKNGGWVIGPQEAWGSFIFIEPPSSSTV